MQYRSDQHFNHKNHLWDVSRNSGMYIPIWLRIIKSGIPCVNNPLVVARNSAGSNVLIVKAVHVARAGPMLIHMPRLSGGLCASLICYTVVLRVRSVFSYALSWF